MASGVGAARSGDRAFSHGADLQRREVVFLG
jgi:hypothetical protein